MATLESVANHVDHIGNVAGRQQSVAFFSFTPDNFAQVILSVGLGSDFDGIESVPVGLEDVSKYPALVRMLGLL